MWKKKWCLFHKRNSSSHIDVHLLQFGMSKFREIFLNLQDSSENFIGCDPFYQLTIARVAFEGIYCKYVLGFNKIIIVP